MSSDTLGKKLQSPQRPKANEIFTNRLVLTPYYASMVTEQHAGWLNDPDVVRFSEQRHRIHTIESIHSYLNNLWTSAGSKIWRISADFAPVDGVSKVHIGTITSHTDYHNGVSNMGIMIGEKDYWGTGAATEAWDATQKWVFLNEGVRKIEMGCHFENRPMRRLAEKCGMHLEGVRYDHFVVNKEPQHLLLYAIMAGELESKND